MLTKGLMSEVLPLSIVKNLTFLMLKLRCTNKKAKSPPQKAIRPIKKVKKQSTLRIRLLLTLVAISPQDRFYFESNKNLRFSLY